jgi:inner membrane protein
MPSIGHLAVGAAAGRAFSDSRSRRTAVALFAAASMLPDADGISFLLGIPYGAPWGHRGATHSLAMAAAAGLVLGWAGGKRSGGGYGRAALALAGITASHGLLDTLTDGGLGVALLWPFSNRRFFAPWRPIPVAPIGLGMLSRRGAEVMAVEALIFLPFWLFALWPRGRRR